MATIAEIKELALHAAKGTAPANFSEKNVNDALRAKWPRCVVQSTISVVISTTFSRL